MCVCVFVEYFYVFCMFNILVLRYFHTLGSSMHIVSVFQPGHALIPRTFHFVQGYPCDREYIYP